MNLTDILAELSGTDAAGLASLAPEQQRALGIGAMGAAAQVAGAAVGAGGTFLSGYQAREAAAFQADQLRSNAGQAQASAQRAALNVDKQAAYTASAALATAAASGGGASDPTVVNIISKNASEFAYRKAVALYEGEDKARMLNLAADVKDYEGKSAVGNSILAGGAQILGTGSTLLKGRAAGASMFQRFGGGGPKLSVGGGEE